MHRAPIFVIRKRERYSDILKNFTMIIQLGEIVGNIYCLLFT